MMGVKRGREGERESSYQHIAKMIIYVSVYLTVAATSYLEPITTSKLL
jgi:hypothetical protein